MKQNEYIKGSRKNKGERSRGSWKALKEWTNKQPGRISTQAAGYKTRKAARNHKTGCNGNA